MGEIVNNNNEIFIGYSDGTIIRTSLIFGNDIYDNNDSNDNIKSIRFKETWRYSLPFPILSLAYGKLLGESNENFIYLSEV